MKYYVTKRPGEPAAIVKCAGKVGYKTIKSALDNAVFTITQIRVLGKDLDVFCDDEGFLKNLPYCFWNAQYGQPIAGPVLVCTSDDEGDSIPVEKGVAEAAAMWLDEQGRVVAAKVAEAYLDWPPR